jgi:hypothetical protein
MAIILAGSVSGNQAEVDSDKHTFVSVKPPAFGALGAYTKALTSGTIAVSSSAGAVQWAMQWTDSTRFCLVERIRVSATMVALGTAAPFNFSLFWGSSFTVAPTTNIGTTGTLTGRNAKRRTSMGTTLLGGMWINGTAAAGMTGQTVTLDTDPIATLCGTYVATAGAQMLGTTALLWDMDNSNSHPLLLAQNEGLVIKTPLAGQSTGTWQLAVSADWMEVASY